MVEKIECMRCTHGMRVYVRWFEILEEKAIGKSEFRPQLK